MSSEMIEMTTSNSIRVKAFERRIWKLLLNIKIVTNKAPRVLKRRDLTSKVCVSNKKSNQSNLTIHQHKKRQLLNQKAQNFRPACTRKAIRLGRKISTLTQPQKRTCLHKQLHYLHTSYIQKTFYLQSIANASAFPYSRSDFSICALAASKPDSLGT